MRFSALKKKWTFYKIMMINCICKSKHNFYETQSFFVLLELQCTCRVMYIVFFFFLCRVTNQRRWKCLERRNTRQLCTDGRLNASDDVIEHLNKQKPQLVVIHRTAAVVFVRDLQMLCSIMNSRKRLKWIRFNLEVLLVAVCRNPFIFLRLVAMTRSQQNVLFERFG